MRRVAYIGYGDLARHFNNLLGPEYPRPGAVFFDDQLFAKGVAGAEPFRRYSEDQFSDCEFYVCLGYLHLPLRMKVVADLVERGREVPDYVHPSCVRSRSAEIGRGAFVYPLCNLDLNVSIGDGTILNNTVTVSHDTKIAESCFICPGVVISGNVTVGKGAFIGAGAVIIDNVSIGAHARIGIGSVVTEDVADGASVIGNPARRLERELRLDRR